MSKSINAFVRTALNAATAYGAAVNGLRAELQGQTAAEVRAALLEPVATFYSMKPIAKVRGEGFMLDREDVNYEKANKALQRLTEDVCGKAAAKKTDSVVISPEARALLEQLDALYATYPEMRAVCNAYIGAAMAG